MRRMGIGLGVGINRSNYAQGIFGAYATRVVADGGVVEAGSCVDAVSGLLQSASLLLIPSGYKGGKLYAEIPTNGNGDLTWTRGSDAFRTNASGLIQRVPWNLFTYSEELDSVTWFKTTGVSITANATSAPNDTLTADRVTGATGTGTWADPNTLGKNVGGLITSTLYTASIYLRSTSTSSQVTFQLRDQSTGSVSSSVCNLTASWQRFEISRITGASSTGLAIIFSSATADFFAWGAQLVEGTTAQTYLPTTDRLNFPRLSYMYGSCPSALLEPQRTNLMLNSGDFQNASWGKASLTFNSTETAPDGTSSARNYSTTGAYAYALQVNTITSGSVYTSSIFLKYTSGVGSLAVRFTDSVSVNYISVTANLINGTIGSVSYGGNGANGSATITALTNGWYRVTVSGTLTIGNAGLILSNLGLGATTFSVWGGQLEAGAYPTTYIPTTSATATRVADSFSRNNIFTNGLISASGGTWFVELRNNIVYTRDTASYGLAISDQTTPSIGGGASGNTLAIIRTSTSSVRLQIIKQESLTFTSLYTTLTDTVKIAIKWNGSTADVFVNGTKQVSATTFTATSMQNLLCLATDVSRFIQQMALFPTPLSDTDCTTLTTL